MQSALTGFELPSTSYFPSNSSHSMELYCGASGGMARGTQLISPATNGKGPGWSTSPGPLRNFHNTYGNATDSSAKQRRTSQYTESWLQKSFLPFHHTPCSSTTNSLMSDISAVSALSALSIDTNADYLLELKPGETIACLPRANGDLIGETTDEATAFDGGAHLFTITTKLDCPTEDERLEGLQLLYKLAKNRHLHWELLDTGKLRRAISSLLALLAKATPLELHRAMCVLYELSYSDLALEAIHHEFMETGGAVIHTLCSLLSPEESYCKYATNILHTLFDRHLYGAHYRRCARNEFVVARLMKIASSPSACNYRHIALENIRLLIHRRKDLNKFFTKEGGMKICLTLMQEYDEEKVLFRIANLLSSLLSGENDEKGLVEHLVHIGGIEILSKFLTHGSPRLLRAVARCMASVSDADAITNRSMEEPLVRSIQILGSTDMELVNLIGGFLCNIQSKSPSGKIFLHDNKGIENLMRCLHVWASSKSSSKLEEARLTELLDTILTALGNLTANYHSAIAPYSYVQSACQQILFSTCGDSTFPRVMLNVLASPTRRHHLATRVLLLLMRMVENVPEAVSLFVEVYDDEQRMNYVYHLHSLLFASVELISEGQATLASDTQTIRRRSEVIKRTLAFLQNLTTAAVICRRQVISLCTAYKNPLLLMPALNNGELEICLMEFIRGLSNDAECTDAWKADYRVEAILYQCATTPEARLAQPAKEILDIMHRRDYQLGLSALQLGGADSTSSISPL